MIVYFTDLRLGTPESNLQGIAYHLNVLRERDNLDVYIYSVSSTLSIKDVHSQLYREKERERGETGNRE